MPSLRDLLVAVALLLVGGCSSFVTGMGESANAALEQALQVGIDGFETADAPAPPTAICESSDPAPQVDASLRGPASAAYTDYDTDGDGRIDSGSHTETTAGRYDRSGWTGVAISTEEDGDPTAVTRYVRRDDVVVLVTLTGGGDDANATVDGYLEAVAAAL